MHPVRTFYVAAALLLPTLAGAQAPKDDLTDLLRKQRTTLELRAGGIRGDGAEALLASARDAQFVLIGEDHGFADVPEFVAALRHSLGSQAPPNLVVEIGPFSAQRAEAALRAGRKELTALNRQFPFAMPFLNLREDGNLAALFVDDHGSHVWGIDQEFVMSPALHLDTLKDASTDDASRTLVESWRKRADAAYATMVKNHDPEQMPLLEFSAAEFAELSGLFDAGTASRTLIDALAASAQIYRDQSTDPYASNLARSQLMKRNFMDYYRAASGQPRAMFKLGAYHAGRGRSPTGVYDIGNLVSELAAANGSHSTHILVLAGSGTVNRAMPFLPGDSARSVEYDAAEELAVLAAEPLLVAAKGAAVSMFDCAALRRGGLPKATPVALRELIFQYDWVVVLPSARAARLDG